jgi:NTP pyrophosphatase (non-canonical NTP hydrolase)
MTLDEAMDSIRAEVERATAKFPAFNSSHEGFAVLMEEVDELWDDVKANDSDHAADEAVQVGAMAARFLMDCCA